MTDVNPTISITALNMSGLNNQIERQKLSDWVKKTTWFNYILSAGDTIQSQKTNS